MSSLILYSDALIAYSLSLGEGGRVGPLRDATRDPGGHDRD
jgi:hypothetical protein